MTETLAAVKAELHRIADELERQRSRLLDLLRLLPAPAGETEAERDLEALDEVTELRSVILCVDEDSLRPALQDLRSVAGERTCEEV